MNSFTDTRGNVTTPPSTIASVKPTRRIQRSNSAEDIAKTNHKVRICHMMWSVVDRRWLSDLKYFTFPNLSLILKSVIVTIFLFYFFSFMFVFVIFWCLKLSGCGLSFQTPPTNKRHTDIVKRNGSYGTLPREMIVRNKEEDREHRRSRGFPSFGRALLRIKSTKRSCSAPNLGDGYETVYACCVMSRMSFPQHVLLIYPLPIIFSKVTSKN